MIDDKKVSILIEKLHVPKEHGNRCTLLGCPSLADLKRIIKMHASKDRTITVDDIILAKEIFEPDVASLKGNTVQQTPMPIVCLF